MGTCAPPYHSVIASPQKAVEENVMKKWVMSWHKYREILHQLLPWLKQAQHREIIYYLLPIANRLEQ